MLNLNNLTPTQEDEVIELANKYGMRAGNALASSLRGTDAFNAESGGEFTADAWRAGILAAFAQ